MPDYRALKDGEQVSQEAAALCLEWAQTSVSEHGVFHMALAGGSTPKRLYQVLCEPPYLEQMPWSQCRFYFGDERGVALDHPDSNYRMAGENLLQRAPIAPEQIHPMRASLHDIRRQAHAYQDCLRALPRNEQGLPQLDLILLGMGDDGHTASLFPKTCALHEKERWVVANHVDALNTWRMTLTFPVLNAAQHVLFLVCGPSKADRVAEIFAGRDYPAGRIKPVNGELLWLLDQAAAAKLAK